MEKNIPTIKQIAKRLNVSISTVSRALHNHPSIGLGTKMKVQALAKELDYEPNQTAIFFKQGKTFTIGVILPRFSEEFFSLAISGIEDYATKNKYNVLIGQSYDDMEKEQQIVEAMKNTRVDGIIASVAKNATSFEHFDHLKNKIPVVFFDCIPDKPNISSVSCNLKKGMVDGVQYLAKKGHERIALINGQSKLLASTQRLDFYLQGLKKNKLKEDPALIVETDLTKEGNEKAMKQLLGLNDPPTAIIAFNDYVALEAMKVVKRQKGISNKAISFVSFAHLPLCNYLDNPPLASVEQFPYEQGYKAMELLYQIINKKEADGVQIVLNSELVRSGE